MPCNCVHLPTGTAAKINNFHKTKSAISVGPCALAQFRCQCGRPFKKNNQCNFSATLLTGLISFYTASAAAVKKELVQFQCNLAHWVNFFSHGPRSSHSEKRNCAISVQPGALKQIRCQCGLRSSQKKKGLVQFQCNLAHCVNFFSHGLRSNHSPKRHCAISVQPGALAQFRCQCGLRSSREKRNSAISVRPCSRG